MGRLRVYVGGAYSADNVMGVLDNIRRGIQLAKRVLDAGFAPFTPWHDAIHILVSPASVAVMQEASMAYLEVCHAMIVVPQELDESRGTQAEMARAGELGIPVFRDLQELCRWRTKREISEKARPKGKPIIERLSEVAHIGKSLKDAGIIPEEPHAKS